MIHNETLRAIRHRRSVRSYKLEQITGDELRVVLEAGLCAPYAEEQGKHFTVIQDRDMLNRLDREAKNAAANMEIPHLAELGKNNDFHCLYGAPTLILVSGRESGVAPDTDCAIAAQNMLLAAESIGLGSCYLFFVTLALCGGQAGALRAELKIPEGFRPVVGVILGYKADATDQPSEKSWDCITYL